MTKTVFRIFDLIKKGELKFMINGILKRILSTNKAFGLKRDLNITFQNPEAQMIINVRPFVAKDNEHFVMDLQNDGLVDFDIPNCYVATTTEDIPCFRQWLIGPKQKKSIKEFWGEAFPVLQDDELLLEGGFTVPSYRRMGIMPSAIAKIVDRRPNLNMRWVITFVGIENIASLKGIARSGFEPYVLRTEKWFLFKRSVTFHEIPEHLMINYTKNVLKA